VAAAWLVATIARAETVGGRRRCALALMSRH
jgi:hypothetical protein